MAEKSLKIKFMVHNISIKEKQTLKNCHCASFCCVTNDDADNIFNNGTHKLMYIHIKLFVFLIVVGNN